MKPKYSDGWCIKAPNGKLKLDSFHPYSEAEAWYRFMKSIIVVPEEGLLFGESETDRKFNRQRRLEEKGYKVVAVTVQEHPAPERKEDFMTTDEEKAVEE